MDIIPTANLRAILEKLQELDDELGRTITLVRKHSDAQADISVLRDVRTKLENYAADLHDAQCLKVIVSNDNNDSVVEDVYLPWSDVLQTEDVLELAKQRLSLRTQATSIPLRFTWNKAAVERARAQRAAQQ